jgi:hypothetical protein
MTAGSFVAWRGSSINKEVHGGVRAAWFMYGKSSYIDPCFADTYGQACNISVPSFFKLPL